jgi:hypothetical protein
LFLVNEQGAHFTGDPKVKELLTCPAREIEPKPHRDIAVLCKNTAEGGVGAHQ